MTEYCPICQSVTVHSEGRCVVCGTASHFASPDGSNYSLCHLRVIGQDVLSAPRKFWKWNELSLYHAAELVNQRYRSH